MNRVSSVCALLLITGLAVVAAVRGAKQPAVDSSEMEMSDYGRIDNDVGDKQTNENDAQISVLSRQLKMLTDRRQEDYRMLERSLHSYVQKHFEEYMNADVKKELKDLR
jgi:hypothetical protein